MDGAFPDNAYTPSGTGQGDDVSCIAFPVQPDLLCPEFGVAPRQPEVAAGMTMPEAAMHEDYNTVPRQLDVRPSWQVSAVLPIAETRSEQCCPHQPLWLCVSSVDSCHHAAAGGPGETVSILARIALDERRVEDDERFGEGGYSQFATLFSHRVL